MAPVQKESMHYVGVTDLVEGNRLATFSENFGYLCLMKQTTLNTAPSTYIHQCKWLLYTISGCTILLAKTSLSQDTLSQCYTRTLCP